ncbi:MAG: hypothetical protein AAF957_24080 [Planctomycetota bacterium]
MRFPLASVLRALPAPCALLLLLAPNAPGRQCEGYVMDILARAAGTAVDRSDGSRVVVVEQRSLTEPSRLRIFDRVPGSAEFRLADAGPEDPVSTSGVAVGVAVEGDLVAHQGGHFSPPDALVFVHERVAAGWSTREVRLEGARWNGGRLCAISGRRIAALSTDGWNRPVRVNIIEQEPASGRWRVTDTVTTDVRSPWIDYGMDVEFDGECAVVGQLQGADAGRVAIVERDAAGTWSQTQVLDPPTPTDWSTDAVALEAGRLAVVRTDYSQTFTVTSFLDVYERLPSGAWAILGRTVLSPSAVPGSNFYSLALDGDRIAVADGSSTTTYVLGAGGALSPERTVLGIGIVDGYDDGRLVGSGPGGSRRLTRSLQVPATPGTTEVCRLRGLVTCPGTGSARLRIHDDFVQGPLRRAAFEVLDAPPGSTVLLLRSPDPGASPVLGGRLCLDRASATLAAMPGVVGPSGRLSGALDVAPAFDLVGFDDAVHVQAVVRGPVAGLTNSLAWLP